MEKKMIRKTILILAFCNIIAINADPVVANQAITQAVDTTIVDTLKNNPISSSTLYKTTNIAGKLVCLAAITATGAVIYDYAHSIYNTWNGTPTEPVLAHDIIRSTRRTLNTATKAVHNVGREMYKHPLLATVAIGSCLLVDNPLLAAGRAISYMVQNPKNSLALFGAAVIADYWYNHSYHS